MRILVTGGAGYIGSHTALRLTELGHEVSIVDNLFRGHRAAAERVAAIGKPGQVEFHQGDIGDTEALKGLMKRRRIEAVVHFAALAYVGESVEQPLRYWRANMAGTLSVLEAMEACGVTQLVFSSTCSTYGVPAADQIPIREETPQRPVNPYGEAKLAAERAIIGFAAARAAAGLPFHYALLRYFNVAGSDAQMRLGEDHTPETHLVPSAILAALGRRGPLQIFGRDWATRDGTCIRDYVHVSDLADAHIAALGALGAKSPIICNVGIGAGSSVLEVIAACEKATGRKVPVVDAPRRPGDPPELVAAAGKIEKVLGWRAKCTDLAEICGSAARWYEANPRGYAD